MIREETLNLLEWPRLCQHLSTFAATKLGSIAARSLPIPDDRSESLHLLAQTQEAYTLETTVEGGLSFGGIRDIGSSLDRAEIGGILDGNALLDIATTLYGARQLRRAIEKAGQNTADNADLEFPVLERLVSELRTYPELEQEIHRCIDDRANVADRASTELESIRRQLKQTRDRIHQTLNRIMQRQGGALQEQLITTRSDRFVLPVKAPQKDKIPGIVHDASATGATLYIEPKAIVNDNNQLRTLERREKVAEEAVLRALTERVAEVKPDLERLLAIVTTLDLAAARARYGLWLEANPPRFVDTEENTTLRQLRHPLLVWQQKHEAGRDVVPIDVTMSPQIRVVTITGPNTGGKTVTLKTLGLAMLMAKVGMFVPAREPVELPWFSQVLADIGDEQSIEQNLSTFSGHVRRISRILEAVTEDDNALVLLDEVGAGTDPSEGSALAMSLLQYLCDRAGLTVATTHFGELKALKYQDDRFENASVEFDDASLSPTYRLLWGIPGRSNALSIARRLGLTSVVVDSAQEYVTSGISVDVNETIAQLEAQRRRQETKADEASQIVAQAERLNQEIAEKAEQLRQREERLKLEQERAIREAIEAAKEEIAKVIRRLQQGTPTAQDAQKATAAIDTIAERDLPSRREPPKPKPGFRPKEGDRVRIPRLGQTAEVLSEADKDGELVVRFGLMKMTVPLADVESLSGEKPDLPQPKAKPAPTVTMKTAPVVRTSKNTLDLRGNRIHEAEHTLENAIAEAVPVGGALWIIHGKGTGKLREGVHEFLKRSSHIDRFELAQQKDGGAGVTVAYLK
ncbi:Recombination inhibitory protein MutS2 [Geitlerinema sp. FC II]|nr:Recombination inhibitory protein MutS2 [Geitlerinema sp. FC II]